MDCTRCGGSGAEPDGTMVDLVMEIASATDPIRQVAGTVRTVADASRALKKLNDSLTDKDYEIANLTEHVRRLKEVEAQKNAALEANEKELARLLNKPGPKGGTVEDPLVTSTRRAREAKAQRPLPPGCQKVLNTLGCMVLSILLIGGLIASAGSGLLDDCTSSSGSASSRRDPVEERVHGDDLREGKRLLRAANTAREKGDWAQRKRLAKRARSVLSDCVAATPGRAGCWYERGWAQKVLKDTPAACSDWRRAERLDEGLDGLDGSIEKYCR